MNISAEYVFEISWEVCNKVGGIYTVLTSKVEQIQSHYKNYYMIGPYVQQNVRLEFTEEEAPPIFKQAFDELRNEKIICHYGRWDDIKGKPKVILVEFFGMLDKKDGIKSQYWEDYKIDSLRGYWDFEEPSMWSYCVGKILQKVYEHSLAGKKVVAQFHEWLCAFGLLYLKKNCKDIATIFTTHATVLGRTLSSNGVDLYHSLDNIDAMREAYRFDVEAKHLTEKAAAVNADIFTTVSDITGIESEKFLTRKPDVILYNGLDIEKFPGFEDISVKHRASREKIREFLTYYYFPYYTFDIDKNLMFYTIGRYEYHNKGYDLLIRALGQLNGILKKDSNNPHTVTVFFWIPMEQHGMRIEVLENKNYYMHIKNYVNANGTDILTRLIYDVISRKEHVEHDIINDTFIQNLRKDLVAFERKGHPPLSTHNIDEQSNQLIVALKQNGLLNRREDMVKVIVEPVYLDGNDGFIDLTYYDAIIGCHLGLFPSYYEPWGYTPLESVALGVPALTTDLSGFGMFVKSHDAHNEGIYVLDRLNVDEDLVLQNFTSILYKFIGFTQQQRTECKLHAKKFSALADWELFVEYYIKAHNMALQRVNQKTDNLI
ncbi:MAG: glycogen/starch synthase [Candidatus Woesearchaeota archaeon]